MKKILIALGDGFEEIEALASYDVLKRAGCEVILANANPSANSAKSSGADSYGSSDSIVIESKSHAKLPHGGLVAVSQTGLKILCDTSIQKFTNDKNALNSLDAVLLPGGMRGVENLANCETLGDLLKNFINDKNKIIAAICAAPLALANFGVLENRHFTCYPSIEKMIAKRDGSAIFESCAEDFTALNYTQNLSQNSARSPKDSIESDKNPTQNFRISQNVIRDGNLLTSRGPATALEFAFCLCEALCGKESANALRSGMLVK